MSIAQREGARELKLAAGRLRWLAGAPLITPAKQYVFPQSVPGEEEALGRGSIYLEVSPVAGPVFLAQCAIGFTGQGIANGLWPSPVEDEAIAVAGGYAYCLPVPDPQGTALLPLRPVVDVVQPSGSMQTVFIGYHEVLVREANGTHWSSGRISWEGIAISGINGDLLTGTGWDMIADEEVPFSLDLRTRVLTGGGYRSG